jgi:hypothetical protein
MIADPHDTLVPVRTAYQPAAALPDAHAKLLNQIGHHLPRRGAPSIAASIVQLLDDLCEGMSCGHEARASMIIV